VLITGAAGQDAHYISKICYERGDHVVGGSKEVHANTDYKYFHRVVDWESLQKLVLEEQPQECYHLAAHHGSSTESQCDDLQLSFDLGVTGTALLLDAIRAASPYCRVLLAGSCHMFGVQDSMKGHQLHEHSAMSPETPYAWAKWSAMQLGRAHRESGALPVCTAILFNHESPRRRASFVTQMLARAAARAEHVEVRDLHAVVDWGAASDYARAMVMMLAAPKEKFDDYVVATGEARTVADFARAAFDAVGLRWTDYVSEAREPTPQRRCYVGDPRRIVRELGWRREVSFEAMVGEMVMEASEKLKR
jgi:GDPmannose 4,6-dehydratase